MRTIENLKLFKEAEEIHETLQAVRSSSSTTQCNGPLGTLIVSKDPSELNLYWLITFRGKIRELIYGYLTKIANSFTAGQFEIEKETINSDSVEIEVKYYILSEESFGKRLVTNFKQHQSYDIALEGLVTMLEKEGFDEYEIRSLMSTL